MASYQWDVGEDEVMGLPVDGSTRVGSDSVQETSTETTRIILLVDDNPTNLEVLFETLNHLGFRLLVAEDGETALEQMVFVKPDIILLDVMMPGIDGFETCRRLKQDPSTSDIPVIFLTALTETVDRVRGFQLGAVDYITKPIEPDEVMVRVQTHLSVASLRQQLQHQNQKLQASVEEHQKMEEKLRLLLHSVSHDLRNPATGLAMVLQSLLEQDSIHLTHAMARRMLQSCDRQLRLINSLVESEAAERWGITINLQSTSLVQWIPYIIAEWQPRIDQHQSVLFQQVPETLPLVEMDPYQVWRVFDNLISNALKYNTSGLTLIIGAKATSTTHVHCWVEDNGVGLSPEQAAQLFQRYSRGINVGHTVGLGLGLYLCQSIIEAHGGEMGVISQPQAGAQFWFTLPMSSSPLHQEDPISA